jgi:hypothetical protein
MEVCFSINGVRHCFVLPVMEFPVSWGRPGPGPVNYPPFIQDAIILASLEVAIERLGEGAVRDSARQGIRQALDVLQSRAAEGVAIQHASRV